MSIEFAEKILDSMVDENGNCGERAMSKKQFDILYESGNFKTVNVEDCGGWEGDYAFKCFTIYQYEGTVGKYFVKMHEFNHFHSRYVIESITLRPVEEVEREAYVKNLAKFENSDWVAEPKKRIDLDLILIRDNFWQEFSWRGYGYDTKHCYTFADKDGNCFVWFTTSYLEREIEDENGRITYNEIREGDNVTLRATVKEHSEFKGIKQTVLTRCKVA